MSCGNYNLKRERLSYTETSNRFSMHKTLKTFFDNNVIFTFKGGGNVSS
jgi:hypothetical protein